MDATADDVQRIDAVPLPEVVRRFSGLPDGLSGEGEARARRASFGFEELWL
jgi:hypothetical protein